MLFKKKKNDYYDMRNVLSHEGKIYILYGGRNAGKSYQVKNYIIEDFFEKDHKFMLTFRYSGTRTTKRAREAYFKDVDIIKLSKGMYSGIGFKGGSYYLTQEDDKGKVILGPCCGYLAYVNEAEDGMKSDVFIDVYNLVLEEFICKDGYLFDEVYLFESLISTVFRDRIKSRESKIFMIGNPISRVCPYITEWDLGFIKTMKIDEIKEVERNGKKIVVEKIRPREDKEVSSAISKKAQQVEVGEWMTDDYPKLMEWQKYDQVYEFIFTWDGFAFHCHALADNNELFLLIHNYTKRKIEEDMRVVGDITSTSLLYTQGFTPICDGERKIFNLIKLNKIFFVNDLQAADFYSCLNSLKKSF